MHRDGPSFLDPSVHRLPRLTTTYVIHSPRPMVQGKVYALYCLFYGFGQSCNNMYLIWYHIEIPYLKNPMDSSLYWLLTIAYLLIISLNSPFLFFENTFINSWRIRALCLDHIHVIPQLFPGPTSLRYSPNFVFKKQNKTDNKQTLIKPSLCYHSRQLTGLPTLMKLLILPTPEAVSYQ